MKVTDEMVNRFLRWSLPDNLRSDNCATMPCYPNRTGTNLMNAQEARKMLEFVLAPEQPEGIDSEGGSCD